MISTIAVEIVETKRLNLRESITAGVARREASSEGETRTSTATTGRAISKRNNAEVVIRTTLSASLNDLHLWSLETRVGEGLLTFARYHIVDELLSQFSVARRVYDPYWIYRYQVDVARDLDEVDLTRSIDRV